MGGGGAFGRCCTCVARPGSTKTSQRSPLFVCGLPGGVDYALLFLVKLGKLSKAREKSINRFLNMWIRLPGILSFVPFAYCCYAVGRTSVGPGLLTLQAVLNSFNAIYFADRVVANAATHALKSKEAAAGAKDASR